MFPGLPHLYLPFVFTIIHGREGPLCRSSNSNGNEARTLVFALFTNPSSLVPSLLCDGTVDGTQEPGTQGYRSFVPRLLIAGV